MRRIIKHSKPEKIDLLELAMGYESKWQGYYKYPGRSNWEKLPHSLSAQNEVFNSIKTFVVFVAPHLEDQFVANYNIHSTKQGRILKRRFKNYGAEINISVNGMLTKA